MTFDTSKEAVERLPRYMVPGGHGIMAHSAGLLYRRSDVDPLIEALLARAEAAEAERDALKAKLALRTGEADAKSLIIKELESEVKEAQIDAIRAALEEAAEVAANEADYVPVKPNDFRKAIRAIDPAAIAAKLKGDGDGVI